MVTSSKAAGMHQALLRNSSVEKRTLMDAARAAVLATEARFVLLVMRERQRSKRVAAISGCLVEGREEHVLVGR